MSRIIADVKLERLRDKGGEWFIQNDQEAFKYRATEESGLRDNTFEQAGESSTSISI